ncbi:HNH endonuclease [Microbulbifer variabilis]|uniref:HNH endonuclease n=1 Tax=Microbulbifer variabilis TaxID=266805 RepID=A0ABY4VE43_9GAMM|nr:HNH endonuclease [Microbulbifer variabilis]USD22558.1 HNH endonuclease [Microbulbifer variabilis]
MEGTCFLCKENKELTVEHIIPQAIGGFLKEPIYCSGCNNKSGEDIDSTVTSAFARYASLMNVKRERGENQPFVVNDKESGLELEFRNNSFNRKTTIVEKETNSEGVLISAQIYARSTAELNKIKTGFSKKYNIPKCNFRLEQSEIPPPIGEVDLILTGNDLYRAIAKIAYGFACIKIPKERILSSHFDGIREYIKGERDSKFVSLNYESTSFMSDNNRPLNKICITYNRLEGIVIGYVAIFGAFRYTILLGEQLTSNIEWATIDHTADPIRRREIPTPNYFIPPRISKNEVLYPNQTEQSVIQALNDGLKLIRNHSDALSDIFVNITSRT